MYCRNELLLQTAFADCVRNCKTTGDSLEISYHRP